MNVEFTHYTKIYLNFLECNEKNEIIFHTENMFIRVFYKASLVRNVNIDDCEDKINNLCSKISKTLYIEPLTKDQKLTEKDIKSLKSVYNDLINVPDIGPKSSIFYIVDTLSKNIGQYLDFTKIEVIDNFNHPRFVIYHE